MEIEYSLAASSLFTWGITRAKAAGDAIVDKALQVAVTRLESVVRDRLGNNEAIEDLDEETAAAAAVAAGGGEPPAALTQGTHDSLVRSLERAAKKDHDFATTLADALAAVRAADPEAGTRGRSGDNIAQSNTTSGPMSPINNGDGATFSYTNTHAAPATPHTDTPTQHPARPADEENGGNAAGPTRPGTGHR